MKNMTDITELSDAALDVFLSVKIGDNVTVTHLSPTERLAVANALGVKAPLYWVTGFESTTPRSTTAAFDYEGAILDRQDAFFED